MDENIYDLADKAIKYCVKLGVDFTDFRFQNKRTNIIRLKDANIEEVNSGQISGFSVRVLHNGFFGFASSNNISDILSVAENAVKIAKSIRCRGNVEDKSVLSESKVIKDTLTTKVNIYPDDVDIKEKIDIIKTANSSAKEVSPFVRTVKSIYSDQSSKNIYINSEGTSITNNGVSVNYVVVPIVKKENNIQQSYGKILSLGGFDKLILKDPVSVAIKTTKIALSLLDAELPPSGNMTVILHPNITGLFAHEAVGHASEADTVLSNASVLKGFLGKKIASDFVSVIDNGSLKNKNGYYSYDDEGVKSQKTEIIKNGVLNSYLHTRQTASKFGCKSTGNARAQSFAYRPIPRMSNTYFDKGDYSLDDMLSTVKDGLYLQGFTGGQVSPSTGDFTFGIERGFIIKNGQKTKMIRDCSLSGNILEVLKNIDAVGNDCSVDMGGMCGKDGQSVPVDNGGPHLRIKSMLVGGRGD
ncbi:MAG: TldD/PmbA family protein [DPANN group archaeon]|nr:TldD/PmbA family protein [DPANN group archaeon]